MLKIRKGYKNFLPQTKTAPKYTKNPTVRNQKFGVSYFSTNYRGEWLNLSHAPACLGLNPPIWSRAVAL